MSNWKQTKSNTPGMPRKPAIKMVIRLTGIIKAKDVPMTLINNSMINPTAELNINFHSSFIGLKNNCAIKYSITNVNKAAITTLITSMTISP
jgi:hypothetical protein